MLKNYFTTAIRNLTRNAGSTIINMIGLILGITCSIVLFLVIRFGLSYNDHHVQKDRIYRLITQNFIDDGEDLTPGIPIPLMDAFREDIRGIDRQVFIGYMYEQMLVSILDSDGETRYHQLNDGKGYTEKSFFEIFTRGIVAGSVDNFDEPNKLVISEKLAARLFPGQEAVGQYVTIDKKEEFEIIAVMKDYPRATDFPFDMFISFATVRDQMMEQGWGSISSDDQLYVLLEKGTTPEEIDRQLIGFVQKNYNEEDARIKVFSMQSLNDLHHDDRLDTFSYRSVSRAILLTLGIIGFFLILTASVNFINLSTAVAIRRSREIGIRKVLGGNRKELVMQFLGETFIIVLVSLILSMGLTELMLIRVNSMFNMDIVLTYDVGSVLFFIALLFGITLLAGLYPAFILSGYKPVEALRSKFVTRNEKGFTLRKGLVTVQFLISQVFIMSTIVLLSQMDYIQSLDLGFNPDAIINLPLPDNDHSKKKVLKSEMLNLPGVQNASLIFSTPASSNVSITNFSMDGSEEDYNTAIKFADENFFELYEMKFLRGEGLNHSDTLNRVVVNEEWLQETGLSADEAVGKMVRVWGYHVPVSGVVSNFHTMSAHNGLQPVMIMSGLGNTRLLSLKIDGNKFKELQPEIQQVWKKFYPEYTFEYQFVDESIREFYDSDARMGSMFSFFAMIAIGIGCLGLFGLMTYTTNLKTKEIGIRKVHGASTIQIFSMLTKEVFFLILIAFILAAPLSWYVMGEWLDNYTYKISLNPVYAVYGLVITAVIALLTVVYRSYKAAVANPANSLRSE